ncbi:tetratricopeptide repeat protein [Sandaracinobacter neustonicus]|nr:tetratricopeptide repeat protein [Sandaracinobacter neustonicus]
MKPSDPRDQAFIREVDEAYREDELKKFMSSWGRWILLAVVLGLVALGGWFWWKAEQTRRIEAISEQFSGALEKAESGGSTEALKELDSVTQSSSSGYRALGNMAKAGIALQGGDEAKAIADLKQVVDDGRAAQAFRDAAAMKQLRLEFDKLPPAEVIKRTAPFLAGDSPWFPIAGEMAALAHLKAGEADKAGPLFYRIASDERSPQSLRARAEQMAAALGQDVTKIEEERTRKAKAEADSAAKAAGETPAETAAK